MMSENENNEVEKVEIIPPKEKEKTKNPKRVAAGKKNAEARKMKAELKRKEMETIKKENTQTTGITKDDKEVQSVNIYKNYIPLCLIGVVGLGLYMYKSKQVAPMIQQQPVVQKKEIDPFEF